LRAKLGLHERRITSLAGREREHGQECHRCERPHDYLLDGKRARKRVAMLQTRTELKTRRGLPPLGARGHASCLPTKKLSLIDRSIPTAAYRSAAAAAASVGPEDPRLPVAVAEAVAAAAVGA